MIGNNFCDDACNNPECNFDGTDCQVSQDEALDARNNKTLYFEKISKLQ